MGDLLLLRERLVDVLDEGLPLLQEHYKEIARYKDIPLVIDVARYARCEELGVLRIYTARDADRNLIGYAVFIVQHHAHYAESLQAIQDIFYVVPEHRSATLALRLIRFTEDALRAEGVQLVQHHSKLAHPALGKMLDFMGYEPVEITHFKRLDLAPPPRRALAGLTKEQGNKPGLGEPTAQERATVEDEDLQPEIA